MSLERNIHALAQLRGETYREIRDVVLSGTGDVLGVAQRLDAGADWRLAATASILRGWIVHRALFLRISGELDAVNPEARSRRQPGLVGIFDDFENRAFSVYGAQALPFAWECVLKFADEAPAWRTACCLAMLSGQPDPRSARVAGALIETTDDAFLRDRAAYALSKLPAEAVAAELQRLEARKEGVAAGVATARDLMP